jgi:hypothetical protein
VGAGVLSAGAPKTPDEGEPGSAVDKVQADRDALVTRLLAVAKDEKRKDSERWQAVAAIARIGNHTALEYLVENISLPLALGHLRDEELGEDRVCFWSLTSRHAGWEGDGRNWNIAQMIFRALGKPRDKEELGYSARALELSLGVTRLSDNTYSTSPRAIALVEAELASGSGKDAKVESTRVTSLRAVLKALKSDTK